MDELNYTAYLAPPGFLDLLCRELKDITHIYDRLVLAKGGPQRVFWTENIWYNPQFITIKSIGDAAKAMRSIQRNWWPYQFQHFRRMELIKEQLPYISNKALDFLGPVPASPLGSFTLIDLNTLLLASHCESPLPNGIWNFNEDKINPPSRAYLKLWELFTRFQIHPHKNETCLDLGASPGGWTWVLSGLAKKVISYDRSALAPNIMALKNITFRAQDAFKVDTKDKEEADWILSDVIAYPLKLYNFVTSLLDAFPNKKYVFTVKFQGSDHEEIIARFAALPGKLVHLSHNKHELTWFKV